MLMNKTAIECWNILKYEIESIIDKCVPLKNKENGLERNACQNLVLAPERIKSMQITKRHLT